MKLTQVVISDPYEIYAAHAKVANGLLTIGFATTIQVVIPLAVLGDPWTKASKKELANVKLEGDGSSLWWEDLDEGIVLDEILPEMLGFRPASFLARLGRGRSTPKKAAAARLNGRKGGRPPKQAGVAAATPVC